MIGHLGQMLPWRAAVVAMRAETTDPLDQVTAEVRDGTEVVHLVDLELGVPEGGSRLGPLRRLNLRRADWRRLKCPVIFWVSDALLGLLLRHAPDFSDWRSGSLNFVVTTGRPAEGLQATGLEKAGEERSADASGWREANRAEHKLRLVELAGRLRAAGGEGAKRLPRTDIEARWYRELAALSVLVGDKTEAGDYGSQARAYWEREGRRREAMLTWEEQSDAWQLVGRLREAIGAAEEVHRLSEELLAANPSSAQAARDVSVSLNKLGDFLASRGQAGDAVKALGYFERSLKVREELLAANPSSAQAARDVSVSLERLAGMKAKEPGSEAARQALEWQQRALGSVRALFESNRNSVFFGRTVAVSFYLTAERAQAAGDEELAAQSRRGCHAVLKELIEGGAQLDAPMVGLYERLKKMPGVVES